MDVGIMERLERIEAAIAAPARGYLSTTDAAGYLGLSKQQMDLWRMKGGGPAFHRVGKRVLYSVADLDAFMAELRQEPLS